jgi:hypothetical protein
MSVDFGSFRNSQSHRMITVAKHKTHRARHLASHFGNFGHVVVVVALPEAGQSGAETVPHVARN